jgi:anti-sigma factor RsiW
MADEHDDDENIESQLEAYALGILEPPEMAAMEAHLATCARCQAELPALRRTVAAFALLADTPDVPVPADHALRFAQKLAATSPGATAVPPVPVPAPRPLPARAAPPPGGGLLDGLRAWLVGGRAGWAVAAALALLLLVTGLWAADLQNQVQAARNEQARLQLELTQAQAQQATLQQQVNTLQAANDTLQQERATALAVLGAAQVVAHPLTGTPDLPGASGNLWLDPTTNRAVVITRNLPPLPVDKTYEFWLIADTAHPAGTFQTSADGTGLLIVNATQPLGTFQQAGITAEKAGGSDTPTAPILLAGAL